MDVWKKSSERIMRIRSVEKIMKTAKVGKGNDALSWCRAGQSVNRYFSQLIDRLWQSQTVSESVSQLLQSVTQKGKAIPYLF